MSTKLFKNTEGKVLMSVGNKLIKQPYEKMLRADKIANGTYFFRVDGLNIPFSTHSLTSLFSSTVLSTTIRLFSFLDDLGVWRVISSDSSGGISYLGAIVPQSNYTSFNYWSFNPLDGRIYINGIAISFKDSFSIPTSNIISFVFMGCFNGTPMTASPRVLMDEVRLWSRNLVLSEVKFMYNNGIYSDKQSAFGLECEFNFNQAELIDFSTLQDNSDIRVALRDSSGKNNHAYLYTTGTNYPAGTPLEKLAYMNNVILKPY